MERAEKASNIDSLKGKLAKAQSVVLADFRGLTVEADTKVRNAFRADGCEYRVVKNTLLGIAVKGTALEVLDALLKGPTAVAYSFDDPAAPARVASKIAKQEEKFIIKGGFVGGKTLDVKGVEALSTLPGKNELRSMFLGTLLAVPQKFLALTTAAQQNFVLLLAAQQRAKEDNQEKK